MKTAEAATPPDGCDYPRQVHALLKLHACMKGYFLSLYAPAKALLSQLAGDTSGSVAVMFSLTFVVVVGAGLTTVDITRAIAARSQLQDALDAATLAAATTRSADATVLQSTGNKYLSATLADEGLINVSATFTPTTDAVQSYATAQLKPYFGSIFLKHGVFDVGAQALVKREINKSKIEIALVLDTTASMSGSKLSALKSAAKDLVETIKKDPGNHVDIAVVPFGQYVNVGVKNRKKSWISVPDDYSTTTTTPASCTDIKSSTTCATPGQPYTCTKYNDGTPYQATCYTAASNCTTTTYSPPYQQQCVAAKTTVNNYKFYGCVGSPKYPKNVQDADPSRVYPGFMNVTCAAEMTPLTASKPKAITAIDALVASGDTYIPAGLAWGFNSLSSAEPLTEADPYDGTGRNYSPRKVLVLMTDGQNSIQMNTGSTPYGAHNVVKNPAPQANAYTTELCNNIKAAKIEVFTVAFAVTDVATKNMLSGCASDTSHFFDATNNKGLADAFQAIADSLQVIRIAE